MKIVRQDSDILVIEATRDDDGPEKQVLAIIARLVLAGLTAYWVVHARWWEPLETSTRLAIGLSAVGLLLAIVYVLCDRYPYVRCLAMDRSSRRVLCVFKTLRRTFGEEFDFDRIRRVIVAPYEGRNRHGCCWTLRLMLSDGQAIAFVTGMFSRLRKNDLDAVAAAIRDVIGCEAISQPAESAAGPAGQFWQRVFAGIAGSLMLLFGGWFGLVVFEMWQAPSWPKAIGVVETIQLRKKPQYHKGGSFDLKDAIDAVYRYSIDGVDYRGTKFNVRENWLTPQEVPFIEQRFRAGQTCQVAYNPSNPARSFLTTDARPEVLIFVVAIVVPITWLSGTIFLVAALWPRAFDHSKSVENPAETGRVAA